MSEYLLRLKRRQAKWLTERGQLPLWVLGLCALAAGLVTFALIMMNHDLKAAIAIVNQLIHQQPVGPVDRRWIGGDPGTIVVGIALFSLVWLGPLWMASSLSWDNYHSLRRLATLLLVVVGLALLTMLFAFGVLRVHARYPQQAWGWPSFLAIKLSWPAPLWVAILLTDLRWVKEEYLRTVPPLCRRCRYDLRGSIPAGRTACPECGEAIPNATVRRFMVWKEPDLDS